MMDGRVSRGSVSGGRIIACMGLTVFCMVCAWMNDKDSLCLIFCRTELLVCVHFFNTRKKVMPLNFYCTLYV